MRIEILDEAERDLVDGAAFYEAQGAGLGTQCPAAQLARQERVRSRQYPGFRE